MLDAILDFVDALKDEFSRRRAGPVPPAPQPSEPPAAPSPVPAAAATPQPLRKWSHPFGNKSNPLLQLTQLANAVAGYYPLGRNGMWHGGVHFDRGTAGIEGAAGALDQSYVRCLADGEVVAYRIDQKSPSNTYLLNGQSVQRTFSRNFVLVRHRLQAPAIEGRAEVPPSLTFYSLYMHLKDWADYQANPALPRPAFWPEAATRRVKATVNDVLPGHPEQRGLKVLNQAQHGKTIALLPRGAEVTVSGEGAYRKLANSRGPAFLQNPDGSLRGYLSFSHLQPITASEYRIQSSTLNVRAAPGNHSEILARLPHGSEVTLSGEGQYRKLESINQYVHFASLEGIRQPQAHDRVQVLDPPVPIKAGELIGHLGCYQDRTDAEPQQKLHLEVFSGENVETFINASRAWAQHLPASGKTWLKLAKGTPVVAHQNSFGATQPPTLSAASTPSAATLLLPKSLLDGLPAEQKIQVAEANGQSACNWYRLAGLLHNQHNLLLDGWVREEVGVTPWVSPWEWEGYEIIFNFDTDQNRLAYFLSAIGHFNEDELAQYGAKAEITDKGEMQARLYDIIDRDRNGKMTAEELQAALRLPALAQSISQLVIFYESEWHYRARRWDALDGPLGHSGSTPHVNWLAEKERIKQLCWWDEVAERVGLPAHGQVFHMHPIGLFGMFGCEQSLLVTREQLALIMKSASNELIDLYLLPINSAMMAFEINSSLRKAHFLAQIAHETSELKYSEEVASGEAYEGRSDLGNIQSGDGRRFKGRGLLQLTGRSNYEAFERYLRSIGENSDVTSSTEMAEKISNSPQMASLAAAYFWGKIKSKLNAAADRDDLYWVSVYVNGWASQVNPYYADKQLEPNHMRERVAMLIRAKEAFGI